jgi:4-amino-4-deoxy-L-arabinose transferase-like glycosyltransferase
MCHRGERYKTGYLDAVPRAPRRSPFTWWLTGAVVVGALTRLTYVLTDDRVSVGGDGLAYHLESLQFADGMPYTYSLNQFGQPSAHHPPGWPTVLGTFAWLGGRSVRSQQLLTCGIGIALIVVAGLVGRRFFNDRTGVIAAAIAAVYPGFWVLEGGILSEPLGLLVAGLVMLAAADLWHHPSFGRCLLTGGLVGLLALVRAEQLALLAFLIAPLLWRSRSIPAKTRIMWFGSAALMAGLLIAPWTLYNSTRFEEPVLLTYTSGTLLLLGNCPSTYDGDRMGYFDTRCTMAAAREFEELDRSQRDPEFRRRALENMRDNVERLPAVVPARFGRVIAAFRPTQTVGFVSTWMATDRDVVWAWVASFWVVIPLAAIGSRRARRARLLQLPLVVPIAVVAMTVAVSYGEPRYHVPASLGMIVLAAFAVDGVLDRLRRTPRDRPAERPDSSASTGLRYEDDVVRRHR